MLEGQADDFVGRDADIARLRALFAGPARLVTIVGAAGLGKTRLALELARTEDAIIARLADARTIDDVLAIVGAALGVAPAATDRHAIAARVARAIAAQGERLLVLDNFEQLTPLGARTVGCWLAQAPAARILVTSREVLRLDGEWVHEVAPLSLVTDGAREADAVRLLRSRIERARGQPVGDDAAELLEIAKRVDGIPLALELAAQRVAVFGATPVLARLGSFLDFLSDGRRDAAPDRRTLRATIAWSWSLLVPHERAALAQCAVFPGSFDADAALHVLAIDEDVLATLQTLREKSLVLAESSGTARFRLLLPIREFARDQLTADEAEQAYARHTACMLERAERRAGELHEPARLAALEQDREDLVAILARARLGGSAAREILGRAVRAIAPLVLARGPVQPLLEALEATAPAGEPDLVSAAGDPRTARDLALLRARLLRRVGRMADAEALFARLLAHGLAPAPHLLGEIAYCQFSAGRIREALDGWAMARAARAAIMPDDARGEGADLARMAFALRELGRLDDAETLATEARSIAHRCGNASTEVTALTILAVVACDRGAAARGLRLGREAVELARTTPSSMFEGIALSAVVMAHHLDGDIDEAEALLRSCQARLATTGLCRLDAGAQAFLGILAWEQGDIDSARAHLEDSRDLHRAIGDVRYAAHNEAALAALDAEEGHLAAAAHRLAALPPDDSSPLSQAIAVHRLHLDLAEARTAEVAGDCDAAAQIRERVRRALATPPSGYEWRIAHRLCVAALDHGSASLVVRDGGTTCLIDDAVLDLTRRAAARALLLALAKQRVEHPHRPLSWAELVAAGWPEERMLAHAARNRVKVTIAWLRRAGLRDLIQSDGRGYWLHRTCRVVFEPAPGSAPATRRRVNGEAHSDVPIRSG
jgi:predicted ATPase